MAADQSTAKGGNRTLIIVGVVVLILLCICALIAFVIFGLPLLLGPAVGDVFSNIILTQTAVP